MSETTKPVFHDPYGSRARRVNIALCVMMLSAVIVFAGVAIGVIFAPALPRLSLDINAAPLSRGDGQELDKPSVHGLTAGKSRLVPRSAITARRFAYFAEGDPSSFIALRRHSDQLDAIIADWLQLSANSNGLVRVERDGEAKVRNWLRNNAKHVRVYPRLVCDKNPANVPTLLATTTNRRRLAQALDEYLDENGDAGIVIDLLEIPTSARANLVAFVRLLVSVLRPKGRQVLLTLSLNDATAQYQALANIADYVVLKTFQGPAPEQPGPLVPQGWFEGQMNLPFIARNRNKIIVGIGSYGEDWNSIGRMREIAVQNAWDLLGGSQAPLRFAAPSLNPHFAYEAKKLQHEVWFLDAVTAYNQARSAFAQRPAGIAVWRLGLEDPGIWDFLGRGRLPDGKALANLQRPQPGNDIYSRDEGEIFDFRTASSPGSRDLSYNDALGLIVNQSLTVLPKQAQLPIPKFVDKRLLALTFDDGPDPRYTPQILDILAQKGAKATFFVIGKNAIAYPELVRRMFNEGHDVGNHTYSHRNLLEEPDTPIELELTAAQRVIESVLGRHTILFRPPYASRHLLNESEAPRVIETAANLGYLTISANVDPSDWVVKVPGQIVQSAIDQASAEFGQIVLLHDSGGDRKPTISALPKIIDALTEKGFQFVPTHRLLGKSRDEVMPPVQITGAMNLFWQKARSAWYKFLWSLDKFIPVIVIGATVLGALRLILIVIGAHVQERRERRRRQTDWHPASMAVLVPAYNEENVICRTVQSLIESPCKTTFDVIVVDDGSKDGTADIVRRTFAGNPRVKVYEKANGGKAAALNYALRCTEAEVVVAIDADTILDPDAIGLLVRHFKDPQIGAVAGTAVVGNKINLMTRFQAIEYAVSQNLDRRAFELFNAISVVPGAIGAWRRKALLQVGGYARETLAEDADVTIALERHGWKIIYEPQAIARTEAPETLGPFLKQRFRWMFGTLQVAHKNAGAILRSGPLPLALITIPNVYLFQFSFSLVAPIMDALLFWSVVTVAMEAIQADRYQEIDSLRPLAMYWAFFLLMDIGASIAALRMDVTRSWRLLPLIVVQRFCYRQLLYVVALRSAMTALKGRFVGWGKLARTGRVQPAST